MKVITAILSCVAISVAAAIWLTSRLAPNLLGAIAVAVYSYMALVPIIQPPIMKALTTKEERMIRMPQLRNVTKLEKIAFPLIVLLLCAVLLPSAVPLIGALMLGNLAKEIGASDLVIGLTIVAAGTSLPELASAIASARRGEHEFVLGNIVGSNLFNTLAVIGVATVISPLVPGADGSPAFSRYILTRDIPLMIALSLSIMFFGMNWKHPSWPGAIQRKEALAWLLSFAVYTVFMIWQETGYLVAK